MTRINVIEPRFLTDEWLIAEYREIKRIPNNVREGRYVGDVTDTYRLGKGHELFFVDKLLYIKKRHDLIKLEMTRRTGKVYNITVDLSDIPEEFCNDWEPGIEDIAQNVQRLRVRFLGRRRDYHFFRSIMTESHFNDILYTISS